MTSRLLAVARVIALTTFALLSAGASTRADPNWWKSLKQPGTGISCCDISDCGTVEAQWEGDHWIAIPGPGNKWQRPAGVPIPIPAEIILKDKHHEEGSAALCAAVGYDRLYCFIPPVMGY